MPGAIQSAKLTAPLNPIGTQIQRTTGNALKGEQVDLINSRLAKAEDNIDLSARIAKLAAPSSDPIDLNGIGWLLLRPKHLAVSQLIGTTESGRHLLQLAVFLQSKPEVQFGGDKPNDTQVPLAVTLGAAGNEFHLTPEGTLPLSVLQETIKTAFDRFLSAYGIAKAGYALKVYQSGDWLVMLLEFPGHGMFSSKSISVFATMRVGVNAINRYLVFRDIAIDQSSLDRLAKVTNGAASMAFQDFLSRQLKAPLPFTFERVLNSLTHFKKVVPKAGTFVVNLKSVGIGTFWIGGDALHLTLMANGTSSFLVDPTIGDDKSASPGAPLRQSLRRHRSRKRRNRASLIFNNAGRIDMRRIDAIDRIPPESDLESLAVHSR